MRLFRGIATSCSASFLGIALLVLGGCASMEEPVPSDTENAEEVIEPPPKPFVTMSADRTTKLINPRGQKTVQTVRIFRDGYKVRTETIHSNPQELYIFNHADKIEFELHEADKIYFEITLPEQAHFRAQREGLIPWEKDPRAEVIRNVLGEVDIEGHPCEIVFIVRKFDFKERHLTGYEYTILWEALDLERQPIRVAYNKSRQILAVVEYSNIKTDPLDPKLFEVPDDYLSFTPY